MTWFAGCWVLAFGCWSVALAGDGIMERLERQETWRHSALRDYQGSRQYVVTSTRFGEAAMGVQVNYSWPGTKDIQVLWTTGSRTLQTRVLQKLIEAELEAATEKMRDQTRFNSSNYRFRILGTEVVNGRTAHVVELLPRVKKRFLMSGRMWVDADDAAIVRMEGAPAASGFWLSNVQMVVEYRKSGGFWLISSIRSQADVRLFGSARLTVDYSNYKVNRSLLARGKTYASP